METSPEIVTARAVRRVLTLPPDHQLAASHAILNSLERFLPPILRELHEYWEHESFDGFFTAEFRRIGPNSVELFGVGILISDQTVTPVHVRMGGSPVEDRVAWMECRVGARGAGEGGMERTPYGQWKNNPLAALTTQRDGIDWVYKIAFGEEAIIQA